MPVLPPFTGSVTSTGAAPGGNGSVLNTTSSSGRIVAVVASEVAKVQGSLLLLKKSQPKFEAGLACQARSELVTSKLRAPVPLTTEAGLSGKSEASVVNWTPLSSEFQVDAAWLQLVSIRCTEMVPTLPL